MKIESTVIIIDFQVSTGNSRIKQVRCEGWKHPKFLWFLRSTTSKHENMTHMLSLTIICWGLWSLDDVKNIRTDSKVSSLTDPFLVFGIKLGTTTISSRRLRWPHSQECRKAYNAKDFWFCLVGLVWDSKDHEHPEICFCSISDIPAVSLHRIANILNLKNAGAEMSCSVSFQVF